jgi:Mycolic acid cyclopropane synthetase
MDGRFGGDPAARDRLLAELLYPVRDTVLDKARLQPGDTVLDVGTGDGSARSVTWSSLTSPRTCSITAVPPPGRGFLTGAAS